MCGRTPAKAGRALQVSAAAVPEALMGPFGGTAWVSHPDRADGAVVQCCASCRSDALRMSAPMFAGCVLLGHQEPSCTRTAQSFKKT